MLLRARLRTWASACLFVLAACGDSTAPTGAGAATQGGAGGSASSAGGAGAGGAGGAPAAPLMMGWNIETFPKSPDTVENVQAILRSYKPAVLGVVEIDDTLTFDDLVAGLDGYQVVYNDDPGAISHVGLVFDTTRASVGNLETLFKDDSTSFPRPPLKAEVHLTLRDGSELDYGVIVLHLKAQLDSASVERRRAALRRLDEWLRSEISQGGEDQFFLIGDMNDKIDDPVADNVFQPFIDAPDRYTILTTGEAASGDYSYIPFKSLIDHMIATNPALPPLGGEVANVMHVDEELASYQDTVSDHRPIGLFFGGP
ncbi:MAG: endonuclease/exonuclease/phosphatase family protein [Polyangiaceae bacterium]